MRTAPLLIVTLIAACASPGSSSSPAPASQTMRIVGSSGTGTITMTGNDAPNVHTLPHTVDQVWRLLPAVLDSLGIPIATLDAARRTMGNSGFRVRGRLKSVPLSRFIDCGSSSQFGPNADSYDVNLTMLAEVRAANAGSATVTTTFEAVARPANFAQEYSRCSSKGVLESRFIELLRTGLQR